MIQKIQKKILLVDDCVDYVDLMKIELEAWGYLIEVAYDGEEAIQKVKDVKPDLILLDIMMPKLNGYEVLKILQKDSEHKKIPVIIASAKEDEESKKLGKSLGAKEYLYKSELINKLEKSIKNNLG